MMGILKQDHYVTEAEFERINNETSELLEYVDGQIYALASPSIAHQQVSMRLSNIFLIILMVVLVNRLRHLLMLDW